MKKVYTLFLLLMLGWSIYANPIALPSIRISELFFDESGNWKLELGYYDVYPEEFSFDSIFLYSTHDTAKITVDILEGSTGVFIITADNLKSEFIIKRYADTVKIISYTWGEPIEDMLIFGDIPGASINYPKQGQSICKYSGYYVKDNSPSIGAENDTTGCMGTLQGIVYNLNLEPVQNTTFGLSSYFTTTENGEYSMRTYSKSSGYSRIAQKTGEHDAHLIPITEISFVMEPDSVITKDIYLQDSLVSATKELVLENSPVKIYPNPVYISGKININIDLPVVTSDICLEIIDLDGKLIRKEKIKRQSASVIAPAKSGIYLVRLELDSEIISSNRIVVNE